MSVSLRLAALGLAALAIPGCGDPPLTCVDVDPTCMPLYQPTWANAYANTFQPKCGTGGSSCHAGVAAHGGLRLDDPALAYPSLTAAGKDYVVPGDPSCSQIIERFHASSKNQVMPRGSRLPDSEICAVEQWIAAGAPGPDAALAGVDATVSP